MMSLEVWTWRKVFSQILLGHQLEKENSLMACVLTAPVINTAGKKTSTALSAYMTSIDVSKYTCFLHEDLLSKTSLSFVNKYIFLPGYLSCSFLEHFFWFTSTCFFSLFNNTLSYISVASTTCLMVWYFLYNHAPSLPWYRGTVGLIHHSHGEFSLLVFFEAPPQCTLYSIPWCSIGVHINLLLVIWLKSNSLLLIIQTTHLHLKFLWWQSKHCFFLSWFEWKSPSFRICSIIYTWNALLWLILFSESFAVPHRKHFKL